MMQELHTAGQSWLHRSPAGWKLSVLALAGTALFGVRALEPLLVIFVLSVVVLVTSGVGWRILAKQLRWLSVLVLLAVGVTWWLQGGQTASTAGLRMLSLICLALAVTLTTTTQAFTDALCTALRPFEKLGWLKADRVAFTIALTLRFVPELQRRWTHIREAQAARGIRANPVVLVVPLLVVVLQSADAIAEAVEARGYPPDNSE